MNLPNKLTLLRIIAVPFFLLILFLPEWFKASTVPCILIAVLLFIAACVTDTLDGRLARKRHLETDFGKFMDPIADKLLVNSALITISVFELTRSSFNPNTDSKKESTPKCLS